MSGALKSSGVAVALPTGSLADQLAKSAPALLLHGRVGQVGSGSEYFDDGFQGVDRPVAGRGRLQTALHLAAAEAAPNSPVTESLSPQKGCEEPPARRRTHWTEELVLALGDLFEAGWSHELMGQALGLSKGSISAKLDRLAEADPKKWTRSATVIAIRPDRSANAARADERRAQLVLTQAVEASVVGVTLLSLEPHHCRWPVAFTDQQTFCAADQARGSSYCGEHDARSRVRS